MINEGTLHLPVLFDEVIDYMAPAAGGVYVDGNLGLGGHAAGILAASRPDGRLIGFEWDREAMMIARTRLSSFGRRVQFIRKNFTMLKETLVELSIAQVDGLLLDLGLSSLQLMNKGRGFSFKGSEPLDMRMDDRLSQTAAQLVNRASEQELADIFFYYGEERQARRIASYIVRRRSKKLLTTTDQLVAVIEQAVPRRFHPRKIHVATKVFQALRIAVNHELTNLEKILVAGAALLKPGGRFCVISFHSLEDRLVKQTFKADPALHVLTPKPITASSKEYGLNPRARSAKLRVAVRSQRTEG